MALLAFGTFLVSFGLTYGCWILLRVARLRQDLFDVRDSLYDDALRLDCLTDPAYIAVREHFNNLAQCAEYLSVAVFAHTARNAVSEGLFEFNSDNAEMGVCLKAAFEWTSERVFAYLMKETLSGWVIRSVVFYMQMSEAQKRTAVDSINSWLRSDSAIILGASKCHAR